MTLKRGIVLTLVVSLAANLIPASVWAADDTAAATVVSKAAEPVQALPVPATNLRESARAVVARVADGSRDRERFAATEPASNARRDRSDDAMMYGGGGGGGKMGLNMMLVGTAVGIGAAYYMVQQLKKTQNSGSGQ